MINACTFAPAPRSPEACIPDTADALAGVLAGLYHSQLAAQPGDPYLAQHATPRAIASHVRTFAWYRPFLPSQGDVLDWGCNHAPDSCLLRATCAGSLRLHGCDFRPPEQYRSFHDFSGLAYTQLLDVVGLPYADQSFDVVIGSGTLEHVAMDYESLKQLNRILKVDGVLILTYLPNRWSVQEWLRRVTGKSHHRRLYGLGEASQLLKRAGLYPISARYQSRLAWALPVRVFGSTLCLAARKVHSM